MFKITSENLDDTYNKLVREIEYFEQCLELPGWENTKQDKSEYLMCLVLAKRKLRKYVDEFKTE